MPSVTLTEAAKLVQNPLISGVIESIVTVNKMYSVLPFDQIQGNAIEYSVENSVGGVAYTPIGGSQAIPAGAKTAATFARRTVGLKPMIGDAYVDHFIQSTMGSQNDQKAVQVASKAKGIGRQFQDTMINGDVAVDALSFDGLAKLVPAGQTIATAAGGTSLTFEMLDELIAMIKAKDGQVDFFMMPDALERKYLSLLRSLGGAYIGETVTLPGGQSVMAYRGVPIFRNDWIPVAAGKSSIYTGCFDDGSRKLGISGLTSQINSGIFVTELGEAEDSNDTITRVRFYCGMASFNDLGVARAQYVLTN